MIYKKINIADKEVLFDDVKAGKTKFSKKPSVPNLGDVVELERDTFTGSSESGRLVLTPTGKQEKYYHVWNGVGYAEIQKGKDEIMSWHPNE